MVHPFRFKGSYQVIYINIYIYMKEIIHHHMGLVEQRLQPQGPCYRRWPIICMDIGEFEFSGRTTVNYFLIVGSLRVQRFVSQPTVAFPHWPLQTQSSSRKADFIFFPNWNTSFSAPKLALLQVVSHLLLL